MIEAIVLDWAGTTIDYGCLAPVSSFKKAFAHFGITISDALIRQDMGLDKQTHIQKLLHDPEIQAAWHAQEPAVPLSEAVTSIYSQFQIEIDQVLAETAQLKPGMTALIAFAADHNIKLATTTGYTQAMLDRILPEAARQGYLPAYNVTSEQTHQIGRPEPDMLQLAMSHLDITDPSKVIKVGDSVSDILEGKNAGTISVGVTEGSSLIGLPEAQFTELPIQDQDLRRMQAAAILKEAGADAVLNNIADLIPMIESLNDRQQATPLLLTPGPLTTSKTVKATMLADHGTWDDDYKELTEWVRHELVAIANASQKEYTAVLMQGSGSFGVEATLGTAIPKQNATLLIAENGTYGERMVKMADYLNIAHVVLKVPETEPVTRELVATTLDAHPEITHFAVVHCETTTGILNPIETILPELQKRNIVTIVDAMSSFGGVPIDLTALQADYLITSSNKCIQGVPGFSIVLAKRATIETTQYQARSLSLDLYEQYRTFEDDNGKWRFTSPTHVLYAFAQALRELAVEGGITVRFRRYQTNEQRIREGMLDLGYKVIIEEAVQSPIITSFLYPTEDFDFHDFYEYLKNRGFIIYPGKVSRVNSFRIGNIGAITKADIDRLLQVVADYTTEELNLTFA